MGQKFTPLAQSRASYYCKGSPVHFVRVELFRMEGTGDTVVTLTFKNLFSRPLVSFTAYFRCKNKYGEVVVEDAFTYDDVYANEGDCFGSDDAVFVSDEPLGSVEVRLGSVTYDDGAPHDLRRCAAVALPPLRPLPQRERSALCRILDTEDADYYPEEAADGWRCMCGAFNYNAGQGMYFCSECGMEKAMMRSALREVQQAANPPQPQYDAGMQYLPVRDEEPEDDPYTGSGYGRINYSTGETGSRTLYGVPENGTAGIARGPAGRGMPGYGVPEREAQSEMPPAPARGAHGVRADAGADTGAGAVSIMKDSTADFILKYLPFWTLAAAGVFAVCAVFAAQFLL
ncbi:MAG: hypothetical protein HDT26_13355 [Subdoligranulum sp.]|nr:hypothetical protein [Subdoligranulum sp.]